VWRGVLCCAGRGESERPYFRTKAQIYECSSCNTPLSGGSPSFLPSMCALYSGGVSAHSRAIMPSVPSPSSTSLSTCSSSRSSSFSSSRFSYPHSSSPVSALDALPLSLSLSPRRSPQIGH